MKLMTRSKAMLILVTEFTRSTIGSAHSPGTILLAMACICSTLLLLMFIYTNMWGAKYSQKVLQGTTSMCALVLSTAPQHQDWWPACPTPHQTIQCAHMFLVLKSNSCIVTSGE
eukprot:14567071-Ditylum_brightwellii.AAC.1